MPVTANSSLVRRAGSVAGALVAAACLLAGSAPATHQGVVQAAADSAGASASGGVARFAEGSAAMVQAEAIGVKYWNVAPCSGVVTVTWAPLDPTINGASTWWNPVSAYGNTSANSQCAITLNQNQDFDWPMFCTVMVHEIGHLIGQQHSTDPSSVMYPTYTSPIAECKVAPSAAALTASPIAQTASSTGLRSGPAHKAHSHHGKSRKHRPAGNKHA